MTASWKGPTGARGPLIEEKLRAFERIETEFRASFRFVQQMHGERRFAMIPVAQTVGYLHALWVCECKDRLLGIPKTIQRYEGRLCLELLLAWQVGDTSAVNAFLHRKLDTMPFAELTRQLEAARQAGNTALVQRLAHGRAVLLNRLFNLGHALDAIFALAPDELAEQVRQACAEHHHTPDEIARQLAAMDTPLYAYMPHPVLARRTMLVMNALGIAVTDEPGDRPGARTPGVSAPTMPLPPYAQVPIPGAMTLTSMGWNNPAKLDLVNPPLAEDAPETFASDPAVTPDETSPMEG